MAVHDRYTTRSATVLLDQQKPAKHALGSPEVINPAQRLVVSSVAMGRKPLEGSSEFFLSDRAYIEIVFDAEPNPHAIKRGADSYVLMRPEGRWHRPGILDKSAKRSAVKSATNKKRS